MLTAREEAALRAARGSISRSAARVEPSSQGLQPLLTAELYEAAHKIAKECVSSEKATSKTAGFTVGKNRELSGCIFPITIWQFGATHVEGGVRQEHTLGSFTQLLLERACHLATKRQGWVVEPTTNLDGKRTNASTLAMHALFLDCDGTGPSGILQQNLVALGFGFVVYESGGSSPELPKWRIVLPLSEPFDVSSEQKRERWKQFYNNARVLFGALGRLHGVGFDPSTETPCHPWFLTERRDITHAPRQVWHWEGGALNLQAFLIYTANIDDEPETKPHHVHAAPISQELLDEIRLNSFIDALSKATSHIPNGRHDLYLCLPGVLLDRGMRPDVVLEVIEAVSSNYPRHHAELHKGNIHNAKTTITKWESGVAVTRIGTLNNRWPDVAKVVDDFFPNPQTVAFNKAVNMIFETQAKEHQHRQRLGNRHFKRHPLSQQLKPILTKLKKHKNKISIVSLLELLRDGLPFSGISQAEVDTCVQNAMNALGFYLPPDIDWATVLTFAGPSLSEMGIAQSVERVKVAEVAFYNGRGAKLRRNMKIQEEFEQAEAAKKRFLNGGDK